MCYLHGLTLYQRVETTSLNTCKPIIRNTDQETASDGVSRTTDIELHICALTCPR